MQYGGLRSTTYMYSKITNTASTSLVFFHKTFNLVVCLQASHQIACSLGSGKAETVQHKGKLALIELNEHSYHRLRNRNI